MIIGPKYKICKRLGGAVFEKCQTQKFTLAEARQSKSRTRRRPGAMSDYKRQLLEKQKMRYSYGLSESQLARYVKESVAKGGEPAETLMRRLESRLDNVVYRMGLAKTRRLGRQIVSHGHIMVDGRKVTVPSFQVTPGQTITIREGSKDSALFSKEVLEDTAGSTPAWLQFDMKTLSGSMKGVPVYSPADLIFDLEQVLEYYSR